MMITMITTMMMMMKMMFISHLLHNQEVDTVELNKVSKSMLSYKSLTKRHGQYKMFL